MHTSLARLRTCSALRLSYQSLSVIVLMYELPPLLFDVVVWTPLPFVPRRFYDRRPAAHDPLQTLTISPEEHDGRQHQREDDDPARGFPPG